MSIYSRDDKSSDDDESSDDDDDEIWPCFVCGETYSRSREKWIQCQICKHWAHEECSPGEEYFICPNFDSDDDDKS